MGAVTAFLGLALTGCGSSHSTTNAVVPASPVTMAVSSTPSSSSTTASTATPAAAGGAVVGTRELPGLGQVLVNAAGRTLYVFAADAHAKVTCTGACASVWPPLLLPAGMTPRATGAVKSSLLGSDPDPAGGRVITYAGWPLYTYVADPAAGDDSGQGIDLNGGFWYVISPAGKVITRAAA